MKGSNGEPGAMGPSGQTGAAGVPGPKYQDSLHNRELLIPDGAGFM